MQNRLLYETLYVPSPTGNYVKPMLTIDGNSKISNLHKNVNSQNFKTPNSNFVKTIATNIQERFELIRKLFVEEGFSHFHSNKVSC